MARKYDGNLHKQNFRPSESDWQLIAKLRAKLGLEFANIVRIALRKLAENEGISQ
jgi:hypothetical protein